MERCWQQLHRAVERHSVVLGVAEALALGLLLIFVLEAGKALWFKSDQMTEETESATVGDETNSTEVTTETDFQTSNTATTTPEVPAPPPTTPPPVTPPDVTTPVFEPEPEPVTIAVGSVSAAQQQSILAGHNSVRTEKSVPPLTWSPTVAISAQAWADYLADNEACGLVHSDGPYGENLYYEWTTSDDYVISPANAVRWWLDEEQYYNYARNTCAAGEQCGHYTQAVWAETTQVGCGVSLCMDGGRNTQLWVCQYNPPGNDGDRPF